MPWQSMKSVPGQVATHDGVPLSLSQCNHWASIYDSVKGQKGVDSPAAIAWATWRNKYTKKDGKWVAKKEIKKGGEGSGRYPAGSGEEKSSSFSQQKTEFETKAKEYAGDDSSKKNAFASGWWEGAAKTLTEKAEGLGIKITPHEENQKTLESETKGEGSNKAMAYSYGWWESVAEDLAGKIDEASVQKRYVSLPDGREFLVLEKGGGGSGNWGHEGREGEVGGSGGGSGSPEKDKRRGLEVSSRQIITNLKDSEKKGIAEIVEMRQKLDHLEFDVKEGKAAIEAKIQNIETLFEGGCLKAYDIGNRIVALDISRSTSVSNAKILEGLTKHLDASQLAILGKLRVANTTFPQTKTIRWENKDENLKKEITVQNEEDVVIDKISGHITDWLAELDRIEKIVARLEEKAKTA